MYYITIFRKKWNLTPSFVEIGLVVREKEDFLRICAIFRWRPSWITDDRHFNKTEKALPINHNCEVWPPMAKRFVWRRHLKSLIKERPCDLSAAILDDVIIRFRQKQPKSDCLIDTFDLIYYMTIFGEKWNLTPRASPIFDPGAIIWTNLEQH